nr:YfhO family protein [Flexilinea sp.]
KDSLPQIYCGILTILCLPYYFFNRSIQKREKLCSLLIIILMIFSFNLSPLDFFWHAFDHPSWFPYRYAFLFSFYLLFLGYQGIVRSESTDKRIIFLSAFGMIFYLILVQKISPATLDDQTFYIGLMFILIDGFILFFGNMKKPAVAWLLVGLCLVETAWNADSTLQRYVPQYSMRTELVDFRERNLSKIRSVLPPERKFYRVEKTEIRTYNDAMLLGYPGIGNFSSVANLSQSTFLKKLGFDCYATWCTYQGRTIFSDSLLGIRFIVSDDPLNYYSNYSEDIYENPYAFPPAFYSQSDFNTFPTLEPDDPILLQNGILNALMGSDKTWFEEIDLQPVSSENLKALATDESRSVFEKIDPEQPASIRYLFTIPDEQPYTLFIPNVSLNYDIWLNGEQIFDDNKNYTPFLIDLDKYQAGDKIEILIDLAKSTDYSDEVRLFSLDLTEFANAAKIIQTNAPQYVFNGKTVFKFAINPSEQDRYLLTSVSYDPGWQATIDGKKVPTVPVMGSLVGIKIPAGSKELILSFRPKGLKVGAGISLVSLILFLMEVFLYGKKKQEPVSD